MDAAHIHVVIGGVDLALTNAQKRKYSAQNSINKPCIRCGEVDRHPNVETYYQ